MYIADDQFGTSTRKQLSCFIAPSFCKTIWREYFQ